MTGRTAVYRPTLDEFKALSQRYTIVPVWREVMGDLETPVSALHKLGTGRNYFLLESAEHGERWSRYSFIGVDPFCVLRMSGDEVSFEGTRPPWAPTGGDPLDIVQATVEGFRAPSLEGLPPLHGGAVGYLGWDIVRRIERLPADAVDDLGVPDVQLQLTDRLLAFDHFRQVLTVVANVVPSGDAEADYEDAIDRCEELVARLRQPVGWEPTPPPPIVRQDPPDSTVSRDRWREMVEAAREYIYAGDVFQVVLSQRFELRTTATPLDIYRMLRLVNPSPYMYLLRFGDTWVVGSSPEALVRVEGRQAITHPIAGTRWRGLTPDKDRELADELIGDPKERAEHVMLVDLARNDLGRVCEYGSVDVTRLLDIQRYSHLMHLVSEVTGKLRADVSAFDVLRATFPAGTVSGAPKVRAMEIIDELEPTRRGLYAGVVGYFDFSGNLDTAIALRTALLRDDAGGSDERIAYVQAGGGIVADAVADDEYLEAVNKASALVNAIRAAERIAT